MDHCHIGLFGVLSLLFLLLMPFCATTYAQQRSYDYDEATRSLYLPLPDLVYGPNSSQTADLKYRSLQVHSFQNNESLAIYNPDVFIKGTDVKDVPQDKFLKVVLESFFFVNRLASQSIPDVSKITMNMSKILNPLEATDVTQMNLSESVTLPLLSNGIGLDSAFAIPADIEPGEYLLDVSLYFSDFMVNATYSTRINIEKPISANIT